VGAGKLKMWNANRASDLSQTTPAVRICFLHINELKTAGLDPDRIRVGDRLTFEAADTRDGKNEGPAIWKQIGELSPSNAQVASLAGIVHRRQTRIVTAAIS
jgi:hypothetical protein